MSCTSCGARIEPGQPACLACGAPVTITADRDPPTETMPAVMLPDADAPPGGPAAGVSLAPPLDPALTAPPPFNAGRPPGHRRTGPLELLASAAIGALVVLVVVFAVVVLASAGGLAGLFADLGGDVTATPQPASPTAQPPAGAGFDCSTRQTAAPLGGGWLLYRAEFGNRPSFDYLRLKLRRDRDDPGTAGVTTELMAPAEAGIRYGVDVAAGADAALIVTFDGPVRIGDEFGGQPGHRVLREFRVLRDDDGTVRAVVALAGSGCYTLTTLGWETGTADITLELESP